MDAVQETIYVVDDEATTRRSLEMLLRSVGYEVCCFADGRQFLEAADPKPPTCILLDIRMRPFSGLHVQEVLRERGNRVPIIFMSAHADVSIAVDAMKQGACDLIEKPFSEPVLLEVIQRELVRQRTDWRGGASADVRIQSLTRREREIAELVATGKSSKEIAEALFISQRTVEVHRCRALRKAGAHNAAELVNRLNACPTRSSGRTDTPGVAVASRIISKNRKGSAR